MQAKGTQSDTRSGNSCQQSDGTKYALLETQQVSPKPKDSQAAPATLVNEVNPSYTKDSEEDLPQVELSFKVRVI